MANIDNPAVIKFMNEYLRVQAEELVRMKMMCSQWLSKWASQVVPVAGGAQGTDVIDDGRVNQGVSVLTVNDVVAFKAVVQALSDALEVAGVDETINLPTVRKLTIQN